MSYDAQALLRQKAQLEARIKTLINNDLRTICKAYSEPVSGNKVQLQQRCINVLNSLVNKRDVAGVNIYQHRVFNHGQVPAQPAPTQAYNASTNQQAPRPHQSSHMHLDFIKSPFYEKVQTVLRPHDLPEMPQNRHTVKCNLTLTEEQATRITTEPDTYKLMLYCAQIAGGIYNGLNIAFPPQIEVKVNDDDVRANFKGLKNKAGSTKPADISKMVRIRAGYANKLSICYALTQKRYAFTIIMVRYIQPDVLVQRIRTARTFSKQQVLDEMKTQNADPDIAATSSKMSLKDPVSTLRITTPVRSTICKHNQCFDAAFFMQLQEQGPTWSCPICSKFVSFDSLCVDKYFEEILQSTASSVEQVTVEPDGQWRVEQDDKEKGMSNAAKGGPRASYDDDFDDEDLVEVAPPGAAAIKKEPGSFNAFNTPPLSSREPSIAQPAASLPNGNKRPAAVVVDLTLSDDEDEPPRPAKRPTTTATAPRSTPQLTTPISLLDRPTNPPLEPIVPNFTAPAQNTQSAYASGVRASSNSTSPYLTHRDVQHTFGNPSNPLPRFNSYGAASTNGFNPGRSPSGSLLDMARNTSISQSPPAWAANPPQSTVTWRQEDGRQWPPPPDGIRLAPFQHDGSRPQSQALPRPSDEPRMQFSNAYGPTGNINNSSSSSGDRYS